MPALRNIDGEIAAPKFDGVLRDTLELAYGKKFRTPGLVGIELEAEGQLNQINTPYWKTEVDGSLRNNGLEFVLKKPIPMNELGACLDQFVQYSSEMKFAKSIRTSCHIHMNVQPFTFKEIYAVIGAYWLFEDILVEMCGPDRVGNLFCLRASDAQASVDWVIKSITNSLTRWDYNFLLDFHPDYSKYAALNLSAIPRYGSLEFRSMRGIYTKKEISQWVGILNALITAAKADGSPQKVYQIFKDASPSGLVDHYFGDYSHLIKEIPAWKDSIKKSSMFLAQLAYVSNRADKGEFTRGEKPKTRSRFEIGFDGTTNPPAWAQTLVPAAPIAPSTLLNDAQLTELGQPDGEIVNDTFTWPIWSAIDEFTYGDH